MRLKNIGGTVRIEFCCTLPEQLINECASRHVRIWDVKKTDSVTLCFSACEKDLPELGIIAENCMGSLHLLGSEGGSRLRKLAKSRQGFLAFGFSLLLLIFISMFFVWDIDVKGCESLTEAQVLRALEDCGVREGCFWPALCSDLVRSSLIEKLPEIAWMGLNVKGSRAEVLISERTEKPEIYREDCASDIIASRPGVIERIYVLNGRAVVSPGETVMAGDTLVSGICPSLSGEERAVRARAEVYADTWYELGAVSAGLSEKSAKGLPYSRFAFKIGRKRINFYISSGKAVDGCDKIIREYNLGLGGLFTLPVSIIREELRPYSRGAVPATDTAALKKDLYKILTSLTDGEFKHLDFSVSGEGEHTAVVLRAQCLENIALDSDIDSAGADMSGPVLKGNIQ